MQIRTRRLLLAPFRNHAFPSGQIGADPVPVRHVEGVSLGFPRATRLLRKQRETLDSATFLPERTGVNATSPHDAPILAIRYTFGWSSRTLCLNTGCR